MNMRKPLVWVLGLLVVAGCQSPDKNVYLPKTRHHDAFTKKITKVVGYQYVVCFPEGYGTTEKSWPMILFLHGAGQRGNDLKKVKCGGLLAGSKDFPFVIVAPQCPEDQWWDVDTLNALLDEVLAKYTIDPDRVYLTGLSMGGYATWDLAIAHPERFAAIAPLCGSGFVTLVKHVKDLPVWVFHGAKDEVVRIERTQRMVERLRQCGGNVKFTVYPEAGHNCWTPTYRNPELYQWFLQHRRQR